MRSLKQVTVSSKGQIAIPKTVREALNYSEGTKLTLEIRGHDLVLSKEPAWRKMRGAAGLDLMDGISELKKSERVLEDSGS